jgi:hypothetical protein
METIRRHERGGTSHVIVRQVTKIHPRGLSAVIGDSLYPVFSWGFNSSTISPRLVKSSPPK